MEEDRVKPEQVSGQSDQDTKDADASPPPVVTVDVGEEKPPPDTANPTTNETKRKRKPLSCFEIWTIVLAGIGIFVAGGTGTAIVWQDIIASRTLSEIHKQYPELRESAEAAKSSADVASDTLKQSQRSFQTDERPYLIIDGAPELIGGRPTLSGNPVEANVWIKNIGKTPAIKEQAWGSISLYNPPVSFTAKAPAMLAFLDQSFSRLEDLRQKELSNRFASVVGQDVAPQARILSTFQTKNALSGNDIGNIEQGEAGLIYTVIIVYVDPFNETHETQFCQFFAGTEPTIWHICSEHNTIR